MFCNFLNYKDIKGKKVGFTKNQIKTLLFLKDKVVVVLNFIGKVELPIDTKHTLNTIEIKDVIETQTVSGATLKVSKNEITGYQQQANGTVNIAIKYLGIANIPFSVIEPLIETHN